MAYRSVDTAASTAHLPDVSKKPHKVGEAAAPYTAKKAAKAAVPLTSSGNSSGVRYIDDATFKKASAKVFKVHDELFRKLAQ